MTELRTSIQGKPVPFARPRFDRRSGRVFQSGGYEAWKRGAALKLRGARIGVGVMDGPVRLTVIAVYPRPVTRPAWIDSVAWKIGTRLPAITRSDLDNIVKAVGDACNDAGVWIDDRHVVEIAARSVYAAMGESPCVEVVIGEVAP